MTGDGRRPDPAAGRARELWAMLGSNQRPLRCERSALPLSQSPWCPQTARLLTAGTLAGQHRLAHPRHRGAAGRVRIPRPGGATGVLRPTGATAGHWPPTRGQRADRLAAGRRCSGGPERPGQAPGRCTGSRDQGRSLRWRITALAPLPAAARNPRPARLRPLVPLNTNNRHAGIKSQNVVIPDDPARKSGHRVVRPTRKPVCFRIGQSTTVRYLNANPEVRAGCEAKIRPHRY